MNKPEYIGLTKEKIRRNEIFGRLLGEITNAYGRLPKGTVVRLTGKHNSTLSAVSVGCPRCEVKLDFTRIPYQLIELIDKPVEKPENGIDKLVETVESIFSDRWEADNNPNFDPKLDRQTVRNLIAEYVEGRIARFALAIDTQKIASKEEAVAVYHKLPDPEIKLAYSKQ